MATLDSNVGMIYTLSADVSQAEKEIKRFDQETDKLGQNGKSGLDALTSSTGATGAGFLSMINPVTLAVTAITAVATASVTVRTTLFNLAQNASELGSELFDAQQKTGLTAETLSAMKLAADQSGSSLDSVTTSAGKFAKLIGEAKNGSKEAKKTLEDLGVTSLDLDTALGQAYKRINDLPEGIAQMTAAQKAFGKSGADLLPFIKSFDGDLNGLRETARKLGVTLTEEDLKAADDFGDSLDLIGTQAKITAAKFALEFAPVITDGMKDISKFFTDNQATVREWGQETAKVLRGLRAVFESETAKIILKLGDYATRFGLLRLAISGLSYLGGDAPPPVQPVQEVNTELEKTKTKVNEIGSVADQMKAEDAKKQLESLNKVALDLANQIHFFGEESSVAAAQQKLLALGISDFSSGQAKAIIGLAEMLDKLKEGKKATDEYNQKLKEARKELASFDQKALDGLIPEQSELDRFNRWAKNSTADMTALRDEVKSTRDFLKGILEFQALIDSQKRFDSFSSSISDTTNAIDLGTKKLTPLQEQLLAVAKAANLAGTELKGLDKIGDTIGTLDVTTEVFAGKTDDFIKKYNEQNGKFKETIAALDASPDGFTNQVVDAIAAAQAKNKENLDKIIADYKAFLKTLQTTGKDAEGKTTKVPLFAAEYEIDAFISQALNLDKVVNKATLKDGIEKLDGILDKLGITIGGLGKSTDLEKINKLLSDDAVTQAIKLRAEALGLTADQLRKLLELRAADIESGATTGTRPRVVETPEDENGGFLDEFKDALDFLTDDKFNSAFSSASGTLSAFGGLAAGVFKNMTSAVGGAIEQWALYGGSVSKALKQALAAELAHVAGIATINALYATALGFIRLAEFNFAAAGSAFLSAGLWAALAGGSALAARALSSSNKTDSAYATGKDNPSTKEITNGTGGGNRGDRGAPGAYSSAGDKVTTYESGANSPEIVRHEIDLTDRNGQRERWMIETLKNNVNGNGDVRDLIKKLIEE